MNAGAHEALVALAWPQARASEALLALARASGLEPRAPARSEPPSREGAETLAERLESAAEECALELEALETPYAEASELLARAAPALIGLQVGGEVRLLALLSGGRRPRVLAPDGTRRRCDLERLRELWCAPHEGILEGLVTPVLDASGLQGERRARARRALVGEHLGAVPVGAAWMLRAPPGRPLLESARRAGLGRLALGIALAGFGASALTILAWIPLGRGVLAGRFEPAWFAAWALLLATTQPLRWIEGWLQSLFGVRFAHFLRRRLMAGATRLDPGAMRGEGAGSLLGRVLDSEALESLLLAGGFVFVGALIDVALAGWVLFHGPSPGFALALFALWISAACFLAARQLRHGRRQADARLAMTHDLIERMQGQRTRVVQEARERWHLEEDALLETYLARARDHDRVTLGLMSLAGSGWLVTGTAVVAWGFVAGSASPMGLALGLGAVLLGQQALTRLTGGLLQFSACAVAWRQVRPLYAAAEREEEVGLPRAALRPGDGAAEPNPSEARARPPLLAGRGLRFRHGGREQEALTGADFELVPGDHVLLEGPSGGGKSTLVSLLAGWRVPRTGSLLLNGLDRTSQGARRWRRQVAAAPQFHENHVFTGTMAFNLLLAHPPEAGLGAGGVNHVPADLRGQEKALEICAELGLDRLIERMPSGLRQVIGETGWQLSHGEKSRLFVARALLAEASLVVLDESLAALDPETAGQVLDCVRRRAPSLLVVAHP